MSVKRITITPEYLSIYVAGRRNVKIPLHMDRYGIFSSPDCINVPACYWGDGDTNVTFGPTRICVWIDHPIEPENVIIAWG